MARLTQAERDSRKREREMRKLIAMQRYVESGKCDHMFANPEEAKPVLLAELEAEGIALINAEVDANPGIYKRNPDGTISLLSDSERQVIPLSR
jgi:hypothetical protein